MMVIGESVKGESCDTNELEYLKQDYTFHHKYFRL